MPVDLDGKYLAYNKAAFTKAGVQAPKTFEELLTACDTLRSGGCSPIAFGNQYGWAAIHFITQLNAYDVAPRRWRTTTPRPPAPSPIPGTSRRSSSSAIWCPAAAPDANGLSHEAAQAQFLSGKAAMHYLESVEFRRARQVGARLELPAPARPANAPGDTNALTGAPDGFLVNGQSKNAGLAVDFLKFLSARRTRPR